MMIRRALSVAVTAAIVTVPVAWAGTNGHGPGSWHVTGVAAGDGLNVRMGPGTDYPVIDEFAPDARGLELITCVPFYPPRHDKKMSDAQLRALPPPWCLMRDTNMDRVGWVAQRFITADNAAPALPDTLGQSNEADSLMLLSNRFMDGYETLDTLQVLDQIIATLEPVNEQSSPFLPTARIRPMTMAVLALEAAEGVRDRVRYRITYGIEQFPDLASRVPYPVSFIQVDRFSMGSAIRQDTLDSYGDEHVGPPEAFDVGPHVSWRLVTSPVQGATADIIAAGRTELSDAQAQDMRCLKSPCLSTGMNIDGAAPWSVEEETPLNGDPVPFQFARAGLLTPAAAIDQLALESNLREMGRFRESPALPDPFLEAVIEIDLAQDSVLDAGMRRGGMKDDSVAAIWRRLIVIPMGENAQTPTVYRAEAYECQRGPQLPPDGGLCP